MLSGATPSDNDRDAASQDPGMSALLAALDLRGSGGELDHIEEPTAEELAAIDELDPLGDMADLEDIAPKAKSGPPAANPLLALFAELDEPELVSLESLDDAEADEALADEIDDVEELLEDVDSLIDDYVDLDLEDDDLQDDGYDLDDDDDSSYHDLYGDDDTIIPSFREGEFAEEEDGDTDYYNELR